MPCIPAHFYTEKNGRLWQVVCLHCGDFIGAAPDPNTLALTAQAHDCQRNRKLVSAPVVWAERIVKKDNASGKS